MTASEVEMVDILQLRPDLSNPRKADPARTHLLMLSISKLGFILPISATRTGLVLSGHQRLGVAKNLGYEQVPVQWVDISEKNIQGINILYNRTTNDFGAMDTGSLAKEKLNLGNVVEEASQLIDRLPTDLQYACTAVRTPIKGLGTQQVDEYDRKSVKALEALIARDIQIPIVITESGRVVNGIHRLYAAQEKDIETWPIITIPDDLGTFANHFLNYLSMDYHVDDEFADLLRYSAYRRPQNNRGSVPKAYRFFANGERTLLDKDSYSRDYWLDFRRIHGGSVLDFGAGLCKVSGFLAKKGIECLDFEPYRIDPSKGNGVPSPEFSREMASSFLQTIATGIHFDSIFLASVLNSVPFPTDRMMVLAIVHALSDIDTKVYGTCRDISDYLYIYGGIRQASYFNFDSEPGVRLGDSLASPKIQKFLSEDETKAMLGKFWASKQTWPGGNVHYFEAGAPKRINENALRKSLIFEYHELPYSDGTKCGLGNEAIHCFNERLDLNMKVLSDEES